MRELFVGVKVDQRRWQLLPPLYKNERMTQEKVAGILGVARRTIDLWEGTSIGSDTNACNPPDLRIKIPQKERQKIVERVKAGESQMVREAFHNNVVESTGDRPGKPVVYIDYRFAGYNSDRYQPPSGLSHSHSTGKSLPQIGHIQKWTCGVPQLGQRYA